MTDTQRGFQNNGRQFYTRSQPIRFDRPLTIVRDKSYYNNDNNQIDCDTAMENYRKLTKMTIEAPHLYKEAVTAQNAQNQDVKMAGESAAQPATSLNVVNKLSSLQINEKEEKVLKLDLPDLFTNVKVIELDTWLQYPDLHHGHSKQVVPNYYIRHFDPVNEEVQNIPEKNWSFKKRIYEINEEKIQELIKHEIKISPSDYEWVIDHFEKTAINDGQQSVKYLIDKFLERAPMPHLKAIEPDVMNQIYHKCWKDQREKRCNRPFIRMFWCYQDGVGPDNYQTFKISDSKNKPNMRESVRNKICKYKGAYQERQIAVKLCDQLIGHHSRINLLIDVKHIDDLEFDRILGKAPPIVEEVVKEAASIRPINEDDLNLQMIGDQRFPVPTQHELEHIKNSFYPNSDSKAILQGYLDHEKMQFQQRSIKMMVRKERQVHEIFWPKQVIERPMDPPKKVKIDQKGRIEKPMKDIIQQDPGIHQNKLNSKKLQPNQVQEKKSEKEQTFDTASQDLGTIDTDIKRSRAENPEPNKIVDGKKKRQKNQQKIDNKQIKDDVPSKDTETDVSKPKEPEIFTPAIELARSYALVNQTKKQKSFQYVDHGFIKTVSMVLHFQKKHLNLNISGDQTVERKFDFNNQQFQIRQSEQKNFKIKQEDLKALYNEDPSKRPRHVVMTKKLRKIEQETRITREDFDQLFEYKRQKKIPQDNFEQPYVKSTSAPKKEEIKTSRKAEEFDEYLFKEQEKLDQLNQEYQQLKNRQFLPRRGRNNRIFYKGMSKTIFDYDSNEEDLMNTSRDKSSNQKRTYGQFKNHFNSKIDKLLFGQKQMIEDIEKHCRNKRLKKNIYKLDCVKIGAPNARAAPLAQKDGTAVYNPAVTNASSDHEKLPRLMNDPVIDQHFMQTNARQYQEIMTQEAENVLSTKGFHPSNVFVSDFSPRHKLADFDEFLASRRGDSSSPIAKKDENALNGPYSNNVTPENNYIGSNISFINTIGGSTNISQSDSPFGQLPSAERLKLLNSLKFFKKEKQQSLGYYTSNMKDAYQAFAQDAYRKRDNAQQKFNNIEQQLYQQQI